MPTSLAKSALQKVGLFNGESMGEALADMAGFRIPNLPKAGQRANSPINQANFEDFIVGVLNGLPKHLAARKAGIPPRAVNDWLKKGEKDAEAGHNTAQSTVWRTFGQADALVAEYCSNVMLYHAAHDWRAANNLLKNRYGYGQAQVETEETKEDGKKEQRERLRNALPRYSQKPEATHADIIDAEDPE